jgi:transcriptional regulator with XRE-family HTH domain
VVSLDEQARQQLKALGDFIKDQRQLAQLSLRDLAARTNVSNPYLSQIERGLHEPSVRVLKAIATALNVSAESLLHQAGLLDEVAGVKTTEPSSAEPPGTAVAIATDALLTNEQRTALLAVYESYVAQNNNTAHKNTPHKPPSAKKPRG